MKLQDLIHRPPMGDNISPELKNAIIDLVTRMAALSGVLPAGKNMKFVGQKKPNKFKAFLSRLGHGLVTAWRKSNNSIGAAVGWAANLVPGFWGIVLKGAGKLIAAAPDDENSLGMTEVEIAKTTIKLVGGKGMTIQDLLPLILQGGEKIIDALVNGQSLNDTSKKSVQMLYAGLLIFGDDWAASTETPLDNEGIETAKNILEDLAEEGGFALPSLG